MEHNNGEMLTWEMEILTLRLYLAESLALCQKSHELAYLLKGYADTTTSSSLLRFEELYIFDPISRYIKVKYTPCISNSPLTVVLAIAL